MAFVEMLKNAFDWDDGYEEDIIEQFEEQEEKDTISIWDKIRAKKSEKTEKMSVETGVREKQRASQFESKKFGNNNDYRATRRNRDDDNLKVVNINNASQGIVANIRLSRFEEVKKVTNHLKLNRVVICDLNNLPSSEGQRALDFVCGACEAVNADIQRAGRVGSLYIITPNGMCTVGDENDEFRYKGVFPWIKN